MCLCLWCLYVCCVCTCTRKQLHTHEFMHVKVRGRCWVSFSILFFWDRISPCMGIQSGSQEATVILPSPSLTTLGLPALTWPCLTFYMGAGIYTSNTLILWAISPGPYIFFTLLFVKRHLEWCGSSIINVLWALHKGLISGYSELTISRALQVSMYPAIFTSTFSFVLFFLIFLTIDILTGLRGHIHEFWVTYTWLALWELSN